MRQCSWREVGAVLQGLAYIGPVVIVYPNMPVWLREQLRPSMA